MEEILIFIKHHLNILWKPIEWGNGFFFSILYKSMIERILPNVFDEFGNSRFSFRRLNTGDMAWLCDFIKSQPIIDLEYFHPHGFDNKSLNRQVKKKAFLMMGTFDGEKLIGYFFIRFFANKKCFVGRLIDVNYRGREIGRIMNSIMYQIAWRMNFRCLSTISQNNTAIMKAHSRNSNMVVIKELPNDYLLVEFVNKT